MKRRSARTRCLAVNVVPDDRPSHLGAVYTQLMSAPGQWFERKPGDARSPAHDFPGACRWQTVAVCLHPPTARVVSLGERDIDTALIRFRSPFDNGPVAFANVALLEQFAEQSQRLAVSAENQAACGVAVEPVCQRRRTRQAEPQCIEIVLESLAALGAAMHWQSRRLVDDQHQAVAIEEAGQHLFRCHPETAITGAAWTTAHNAKTGGNASAAGSSARHHRSAAPLQASWRSASWTLRHWRSWKTN